MLLYNIESKTRKSLDHPSLSKKEEDELCQILSKSPLILTGDISTYFLSCKGLKRKNARTLISQNTLLKSTAALRSILCLKRNHLKKPRGRISQKQSCKLILFLQTFANAHEALGSKALAEEWLTHPVIALCNQKPIDLLINEIGHQAVNIVLLRIKHGVYT
ncbi:antitoxin Xre/MbcA/ParS toxin-binding domain-containing protein [Pseudomonas sp. W03]|uniref:antitoxin Xre/MbcA/ParS toxin-binding domain-containing protein n=1 Tax=Pseudomonas sp. W03 TaxID=3090666 RepID=UPI003A4E04E8